MLLRSPSVTSLFHFSLQYVHWCFKQSDWFGILNYLSCELKMQWLHCGNNTVTTCPSQVIAFWKCQSCLLPLPHPPPPQKKYIAILCNFSRVVQWLQETLKTVLRQFWGGGGGGGLKGGINKDRRFKSGELFCFPVSFFFVLFSWPHKLNGQIQNQQAHDI